MANVKLIDNNKKAYHNYFIEDTYEAGVVLVGSEVKSIRDGHINIHDAFCTIIDNEVWLMNSHIKPYDKGSFFNTEAKRNRKLLLNKHEINKLRGAVIKKGYTLVPTKVYFKDGLVKIEVGVARGKELHDKRQALAEKQAKRDIDRQLKEYRARG